ncbi:HAD family hydrolase [Pseudoxanthomonas daejeonensis]|uniref:HAD family hydrolase n=1 Tax=Pseudoxanthomonas daejeonensis TaxID=266062 RepID=UPI001F54774F|nr:HAD family hydrolase [Pseudoxanthomonas daejeonensis]UNK58637.1 HAD family hydrolase [Pseudoxanthomonas daejeonensis]
MDSDQAYSLVIFDCDGVLVDSEPLSLSVLSEALTGQGLPADIPYVTRHFLGRQLSTVRTHALSQQLDLAPGFEHDLNTRLVQRFREELLPIPHVADALAGLGLPRCVASSSDLARVRLSLEVTGLAAYFGENVYTAEMVARGKPEPDLFLYAARQMGVEPAACLVIEDSPYGVLAARAAGMEVWGFTGGSHHREGDDPGRPLLEAGAHRLFEDMRKLGSAIAAAPGNAGYPSAS